MPYFYLNLDLKSIVDAAALGDVAVEPAALMTEDGSHLATEDGNSHITTE